MSNDQTPDGDAQVYNFPRIGFNITPVAPSQDAGDLEPAIPELPSGEPGTGTGERARRSPLDLVGALPSPALLASPVPATTSPEPGLPATFRNGDTGEQPVGPRLGALSMAAVLAVAVAALRGSAILLEDRRQRAMEKRAESAPMREAQLKHQLAMAQHGWDVDEAVAKGRTDVTKAREKAAEKNAKNKVPPGTEFGRKTLGGGRGGSSSTGSRSGGLGSGAGRGGSKSGPGGGAGRGGSKSGSGGLGSGGGSKSSRGTGSGGSLGGGAKKNRTGSGSSGLGGGSKKTSTGNGSGSTSSKKNRGTGSGLGLGGGTSKKNSKTNGGGSSSTGGAKDKGGKKSPHRTSQGAGHSLGKSGTTGSGHTGTGGRTRKERAAARQDGRLQRRADRQAARLGEKAKDRKAARDLKSAPKQARQDRRNRIRDARADAKEARREQVRQGKFDAKQSQRAERTAAKRLKKAEGRLKKEQKKHAKGDSAGWRLWKNDKKREKKAKTPKPPKDTTGPGRKDKRRKARDRARDARDGYDAAKGDAATGTTPPTSNPGSTGAAGGTGTPGSTAGPRRSPYGNAASASKTNATTRTVERDDQPTPHTTDGPAGALTRDLSALPPAPEPHTKRPGTTRPKEPHAMPPAPAPVPAEKRMQEIHHAAHRQGSAIADTAGHMDPMHATEITLDDALDQYGEFKDDAFKTHRQSAKLAERAIKLRDTLITFAIDLAHRHNLIGALFSLAMARLAESMDLLARMAEEMETSSLQAAEMAEQADNDLNDAYRPITDATADAGLTTPSAPIHNKT